MRVPATEPRCQVAVCRDWHAARLLALQHRKIDPSGTPYVIPRLDCAGADKNFIENPGQSHRPGRRIYLVTLLSALSAAVNSWQAAAPAIGAPVLYARRERATRLLACFTGYCLELLAMC